MKKLDFISKYSPVIGLISLIITLFLDPFDFFEESNSDAAGKGMAAGFNAVFSICLYGPFLLIYLSSIARLINNRNVFLDNKPWTIIHLIPIIFFLFSSIAFFEEKISQSNNRKKHEILLKHEKSFKHTSDSNSYLIIKDNFVFCLITDGLYIEAIGKINKNVFESVHLEEEFLNTSTECWQLSKMEDRKGNSFFQIYSYEQVYFDTNIYGYSKSDFYPNFFELK